MRLDQLKQAILNVLHDCKTSGNSIDAKQGFDIAVGQILEGIAKPYIKVADEVKKRFADRLDFGANIIIETGEVEVTATKSNPRKSFDKEAFIRAVAEQYNLSAGELFALAETTVKESAAPVSITTVVFLKGNDNV